jgi:hypothetical protein
MVCCSLIGLVCGGVQTIEELVSQVVAAATPSVWCYICRGGLGVAAATTYVAAATMLLLPSLPYIYITPYTSIKIHSNMQKHEGARYRAAY